MLKPGTKGNELRERCAVEVNQLCTVHAALDDRESREDSKRSRHQLRRLFTGSLRSIEDGEQKANTL